METLNRFELIDSEQYINNKLVNGEPILAEGAQGSLLDIDFGSYPFVTSSNTVCAGACTGLGIAPNRIGNVIGIFKAYCTRVGSGPFPTELFDNAGEKLCDIGHEFGSTTGRRRRCGWLDLPALKYAIMINGVTELNMMKADVLDTFDTIKVCTSYKVNGELTDQMPFDLTETVEPVYMDMKGWKTDLTGLANGDTLPTELQEYISYIEEATGVPISVVSVGPDREQTLFQDVKPVIA
jgi:adenylosuccinate synthase